MRESKLTLVGFIAGVLVTFSIGAVSWTASTGSHSTVGGVVNQVSEPVIISTTTNAVVFDATVSTGPENTRTRTVQNVGTVPVLYRLGGTASDTEYHGVLAPGSAARDGLGSVLDVSTWRGSVSIAVESGTGVVVATEVIK